MKDGNIAFEHTLLKEIEEAEIKTAMKITELAEGRAMNRLAR